MLKDRWIILALLAGTATAVLVFLVVASQAPKRVDSNTTDANSGTIVIATAFVPSGTQLAKDQLQLKVVPVDSIPAGAATSMDQLVGRRASVPLFRGEPVLRARVSNGLPNGDMIVAPGRTVFALPLDPARAVGGVLSGGDVISIIGSASTKRDDPLAILADDVRVLGVAGDYPFGGQPSGSVPTGAAQGSSTPASSASPGTQGPQGQKIALVDVTIEQARTLAQAITNGQLFVALKARANDAATAAQGGTQ